MNAVHDPAGQQTSAATIAKHPPPSTRGPLLGLRSLRFNTNTLALVLRGRLDSDEAAQRARMLREDLPRLGSRVRLRAVERSPGEHWPFYAVSPHLVPPRFFRPAYRPGYHATGYGLDWGDLVTLSKVIKLARELWGLNWTRAYRTQLCLNRNHLPVIEELWWLGMWHQPTGIERECALAGCCGQTVDWRFQCRGITVNLEVKYRPHDWLRFVNARAYGRLLRGYFRTLAGKFPVRPRGHLNVVGMTLLGSLGEELRSHAVDFLRTHPPVDAFCFWSIARRDSLACECVTQPGSSFVHGLLRPADEEDRWRNPFIIHTTKPDQIANGSSQPDFHPWQGLFDPRGPAWCAHWRNAMRAWLFAGT